jgi:hypothetical protein
MEIEIMAELMPALLSAIDSWKSSVIKTLKDSLSNPEEHAKKQVSNAVENLQNMKPEDAVNFMSILGTLKLYHGGRAFTKWDPATIGTGEGFLMPQGPGLYAGNEQLASRYKKYGGSDPALLELLVDDSRIIEPRKKMSLEHKEAYNRAVEALDVLGLKASNSGIPNVFLSGRPYSNEKIRQVLVNSGIDGLKQSLNEVFGHEYVIFNPDIIKSIIRKE